MGDAFRWGILGAGTIAKKFAEAITVLNDAKLVAVGSRTAEKANAFADQFNIPNRHASYEALASDKEVDAIYVATPHNLHMDNTILCLEHGKHVLCEKPFAINAAQAQRMVDTARRKKLFLMEAMWTRFLPHMVKLRELLAQETIGKVEMMNADIGFRANFKPESRLFDPQKGGGSLLDIGVYPVSLASMVLGAPDRIASMVNLAATGVDGKCAIILGFPSGAIAVLHTAIVVATAQEAAILGDGGSIRLTPQWWLRTTTSLIVKKGKEESVIEVSSTGNGFNYEIAEVVRCVRQGLTESPIMPLDESISIMRTLDRIRAQWNLKYPME